MTRQCPEGVAVELDPDRIADAESSIENLNVDVEVLEQDFLAADVPE